MKIVALLAWYEESPAWLSATAASLAGVCDHLVAVDGAYMLFPGAMTQPRSGCEQVQALTETCHALDLGLSIERPAMPWRGNEIAKRDFMFRAGRLHADETGWFLVIDADEVLTSAPLDLRSRLEMAEEDVAGVTLWQRNVLQPATPDGWPADLPMHEGFMGERRLFRARNDLRVRSAHHIYLIGPDDAPRCVRGDHVLHRLEPSLEIPEMRLEHRHQYRQIDRLRAAADYYTTRDDVGAETPMAPGGIVV